MPRVDPKPSASVERFFERYILRTDARLILTIKAEQGTSVNIDGPFELQTFPWSAWRTASGEPDEIVLAPTYTPKRDHGESSVHLHIPWSKVEWVRLQYLSEKELPLIDERVRISFYPDRPPTNERGKETFWFYTTDQHPLIATLPKLERSGFSEAVRIEELVRVFSTQA